MITRNADYSIQHLRGLSTDTKPTDVPNGSEFREMDTDKDFMYDEASGDWKEQPKKGGGGGDNRFIVTCTPTAQDYSGTMDKTVVEIFAAWNDGKEIYFYLPGYATFPVAGISDNEVIYAYGVMIGNPGKFIVLATDSLGTTYTTTIYQLTPMGG